MNTVLTQQKFDFLRRCGFEVKATPDSLGSVATKRDMHITFYPAHMEVNGEFNSTNWRGLSQSAFEWIIQGYILQCGQPPVANNNDVKLNMNHGIGLFNEPS